MTLQEEDSEKRLYLVRGTPGSGKADFVKSISFEDDVVISTNDFMKDENGIFYFDVGKLEESRNKCQYIVEDAMERNTPCIFVHDTLTTQKEIYPYTELAERYGYTVYAIIVECRGERHNVHDVPEQTIKRMKERFDIRL